jgi:ribosomal protein L40E
MAVKRITCPSCGGNQFQHDDEGNLICAFCGAQYASPREEIICPACGAENPAEARRCINCGLALGKICPACNYVNPPGADHCENCAVPLDTLSSVLMRTQSGRRYTAKLQKGQLVASKAEDMVFMEEQRARIEAEERERRMRLAAQRAEAERQQRIIIAIVLGVFGLMVLAGLVILALSLFASTP